MGIGDSGLAMSDERLRYDLPMPCDPLGDLRAWQQRLERLSRHPADAWAPPIDVYETADAFVVTAEVPGLSRENVELAVEDSRLVITGGRKARPGSGDTVHYHLVERGHGTFQREFEFTANIDGGRISADLSDGVLTI